MTTPRFKTAVLALAFAMAMPAWADRVKDLATVAAQRSNQ
jgi:flagellar basal body P-ring protein FlgI